MRSEGRVDDLNVHALLVHVAKPRCRIEPGLEAPLEALHLAFRRLGELGARERELALGSERFAFDHQATVLHRGSPTAKSRIDVFSPDLGRLDLMSVGIDDPESIAHDYAQPFT